MEARQDWHPWGWGDQERQVRGTLWEELERSRGQSSGPLWPGSLLSSQAGTPPLQSPIHAVWVQGHKKEAGEIRRGRLEEPSRRSRRGAEGYCPAHLAQGDC